MSWRQLAEFGGSVRLVNPSDLSWTITDCQEGEAENRNKTQPQ